jgi:hypothetical protein
VTNHLANGSRVQYCDKFLSIHPNRSQEQGTAIKRHRKHDCLVLVDWDKSKIRFVHESNLEVTGTIWNGPGAPAGD